MDVVAVRMLVLTPVRFAAGRGRGVTGAALAEADDREMAEVGLVSESPADLAPDRLELGAVGYRHPAAALTGEHLLLPLPDQHVEARGVAKMDVPDDSQGFQPLQVPVDGGELEGGASIGSSLGDVPGRHGSLRLEQGLEHEPAGRRDSMAAAAESGEHIVDPIKVERLDAGRFGHG